MTDEPTTPYQIGAQGEAWLIRHLRERGHEVEDLGHGATFDLRVDGTRAEVKASRTRPGHVRLTEAQWQAVQEGEDVRIYLVHHLAGDPDGVAVEVIAGHDLLNESPNVVCSYEWGRSQLDRLAEPLAD